jgi:hypothetical protein
VIVNVNVPRWVGRLVETERVDVEPVVGFGVNDALVLFGRPLTLRETPVAPPPMFTV